MSRFATVTVTGQTVNILAGQPRLLLLNAACFQQFQLVVVNVVLDFHLNSYFYLCSDMYCLLLISRI